MLSSILIDKPFLSPNVYFYQLNCNRSPLGRLCTHLQRHLHVFIVCLIFAASIFAIILNSISTTRWNRFLLKPDKLLSCCSGESKRSRDSSARWINSEGKTNIDSSRLIWSNRNVCGWCGSVACHCLGLGSMFVGSYLFGTNASSPQTTRICVHVCVVRVNANDGDDDKNNFIRRKHLLK